ncbi:hypothetical protein EMIT0P44_310018 [Pseudomonas sp. IT-P44]
MLGGCCWSSRSGAGVCCWASNAVMLNTPSPERRPQQAGSYTGARRTRINGWNRETPSRASLAPTGDVCRPQ